MHTLNEELDVADPAPDVKLNADANARLPTATITRGIFPSIRDVAYINEKF